MLAKDIMTTPVTTIDEGHNVREAVEIVNASKIGAVPVVDGEGRLTGIVTEGDLLRRVASSWARRAVPHTRDRDDALADYVKARSWRVKDVMSTPVISAAPTATTSQLAELLQAHDIKHLPVVENGRLAGMISRRDLMRALLDVPRQCTASGDEALGIAVRSRLDAELEITPPMVNATVSDGIVTLRGEVETELERSAARVAAESVRGVGGVVNKITLASAW
ncbi:CBS domain-containing protein [Rhizobium ruizarguesonis]|uniref:CBS domain-containing protein n=1 Tax=Rhizobium ruizarguesonis TaxID=2081791 RepID=UPI0018D5A0FA|nr:CBS domain-containing protein [Rhizobium ruizarguesonis]